MRFILGLASLLALSSCSFVPLHDSVGAQAKVRVAAPEDRLSGQVRDRLAFLMRRGEALASPLYEARLRVSESGREGAANPVLRSASAGSVTVAAEYELIRLSDGARLGAGKRSATANYDRGPQGFANERALRDARERAAREAAERLRFALIGHLRGG